MFDGRRSVKPLSAYGKPDTTHGAPLVWARPPQSVAELACLLSSFGRSPLRTAVAASANSLPVSRRTTGDCPEGWEHIGNRNVLLSGKTCV
jgi:hypothetical protein